MSLDPSDPGTLATVYAELRSMARRQLAGERNGHTLGPTALVHEAFLRLSTRPDADGADPRAFCNAAALAMRRVLIDHARSRCAERRGGKRAHVPLDLVELAACDPSTALDLDELISGLADQSARTAEVVRLRFYTGLTEPETARALGISERTVRREWTFAKAWLMNELARISGEGWA